MVEFDCIRCGKHNYLCSCEVTEEVFEILMDNCGFNFLLYVGKKILDKHYPEDIFTGESGDLGPKYIVALREALTQIERSDKEEDG